MPTFSVPNVRLTGLAVAVPPVEELSWAEIGDGGRLKIARRRGETPYGRSARFEQCQSDLCVDAARDLFADLEWQPDSVDLVIMATITPDYPIPATAIIVQDRLGIPKTAAAFDLPSGPLGFLHGLQLASSMLSPGSLRRALLLCGQVPKTTEQSDSVLPHRSIQGHSGCVCALEYIDGAESMFFDSGGDGEEFEAYYMPVGGVRNPPRSEMFSDSDGIRCASEYVVDTGRMSAKAHDELPGSMLRVLALAGLTSRDVDACFVGDLPLPVEVALRREMNIPIDRFHGTIAEYGASGSGTIPLGMLVRTASHLMRGRQTSLLSAIGPGLAWGSALLNTDRICCSELLEV